eukprot:RCo016860
MGNRASSSPTKKHNVPEGELYEIPESVWGQHQAAFYEHSANYEDSLRNLQLVILVDHSGSMRIPDEDGAGLGRTRGILGEGWTRWDNCVQAAKYLADSLMEYDKDKTLPIIFFGYHASEVVLTDTGEFLTAVKQHAPTRETTNLLEALTLGFDRHINRQDNVLFIVLTDGAPDAGQEPQIKKLIQKRLARADPKGTRLNVLFIRFGDDPGAIRFLQDLDDCREVGQNVDTKSDNAMYAMGPKNLIVNAIHEHLDAQYAHFV